MTTQIPIVYGTTITAQASAAITAGTVSTGALTTIDNSKTGNGGGCHLYKCIARVTAAPSGAAVCRLYYSGAESGTPTNFDSGSLSVSIPSGATGDIPIGDIIIPDQVSRVKIAAENYGFTASLIVVPILPEAQ